MLLWVHPSDIVCWLCRIRNRDISGIGGSVDGTIETVFLKDGRYWAWTVSKHVPVEMQCAAWAWNHIDDMPMWGARLGVVIAAIVGMWIVMHILL